MVYGNAVFIREEAKLLSQKSFKKLSKVTNTTNTYNSQYIFSTGNFTSFNSVNIPEHKANYTAGCKK